MAGLDSDYRYHLQEAEVRQRPPWVVFHRSIFQEGSVGHALFPEVFEGRRRPVTLFHQPVESLWKTEREKHKIAFELRKKEYGSIGDILRVNSVDFNRFPSHPSVNERLRMFFDEISRSPHERLLIATLGYFEIIPVQYEAELMRVVDQEIASLRNERAQKALSLRFGLEDGLVRTFDQVSQEFGVRRERIRQIETRALRELRYPTHGDKLKAVLPVCERSLGRIMFGVTIRREMPPFGYIGRVQDLLLPDQLLKKLEGSGIYPSQDVYNLLVSDLEGIEFSDEEQTMLIQAIHRNIANPPAEPKAFSFFPSHGMPETKTARQEPINALLPGVALSPEQLILLSSISLKTLGLPIKTYNALKRAGIQTVGDVLGQDLETLMNVRDFGELGLREVIARIEQLDAFPKDPTRENSYADEAVNRFKKGSW